MKATTKQAQGFIANYCNSSATELTDVYGRYSLRKERAFEHIRYEMYDSRGFDLRITSHNSQMFTCAYQRENSLIYHTPYYVYEIENWKEGI